MTEENSSKSLLSAWGLVIWFLAAVFFLYEFFLRTFIGSVAHQVIPDLNLNAETFSIIGSAYYVTYGIMQIPVGILADKFGVRKIMVFAMTICFIATFLFAYANGFYSALLSRLIMGFGSSFAFICLLVIAITWFPRKYFGFFAGSSQFIGTMGPLLAAGPLISLMVSLHEDWRSALIQIGFLGIVLALLIFFIVRDKPRQQHKLIFLRPEAPLKKCLLKLLKNRQAWCIALYSAMVYVPIALLGAIWGTEYLQVNGLSQSSAADIISLAWLGYAIACPLLGFISDIAKRRKLYLIIPAIIGFVSTLCITFLHIHQARWFYAILFFALGIASAGQNIGFAIIAEQVDVETRATALGLNNSGITLFSAIIPPLASYFIYLSSHAHPHHMTAMDFVSGFAVMPVMYFVAMILSFFSIKETYCKPQKESIILKI